MVVMSPRFATCGQWWASTEHGKGSISANQAGRQPSGSQATLAASIPLHTEP